MTITVFAHLSDADTHTQGFYIRMYVFTEDNIIQECSYDPGLGWYFYTRLNTVNATVDPNSDISAVWLEEGVQGFHLYFQPASAESIEELIYDGTTWLKGNIFDVSEAGGST